MPSSTALSTEAVLSPDPPGAQAGAGLLPAALNGGHTYRDRVGPAAAGQGVSTFLAARYRHSDATVWQQRLAAGEIAWNGQRLRADVTL